MTHGFSTYTRKEMIDSDAIAGPQNRMDYQ